MKLYPHQEEALKASQAMNRVAYYWDMGLGKTFAGAEKLMQLQAPVSLVVCQKSKLNDWMDHFRTYYPDTILFDLTNKNALENFLVMTAGVWGYNLRRPCIGFVNYDLLFRRPDLKRLSGFTLLLDESSIIQNDTAKRTKFILNMHPQNVILLSGTPVSGRYENLWSQIHLLGWNISKDLYESQYVNWVRVDDGTGLIRWEVDKKNPYKNVARLKEKLRENGAFFLKTEECFQLPEQTFTTVRVPVSREYKTFRKKHIVTVNGEELIGDHVFKDRMYSRQLCGQYSMAKLEAFADLVSATRDRLIVFYNFTAELAAMMTIVQEAGKPVSIVNGSTKDLSAYETEDDSVTFIQYQAGAMGLNLQKANKIIYFTLTDRSELFEQSKKRIHRIGQDHPCFYYLLICENSIEEWILKTLNERRDFTDELFRELEKENHV